MPDLNFQVEGAEPQRFAAAPLLLFKLRVTEAVAAGRGADADPRRRPPLPDPHRAGPAALRRRRRRSGSLDLFGTPERWGQTLRPMLWTHVSVVVPPFDGRRRRRPAGAVQLRLQPGGHEVFRRPGRGRHPALLPVQRHHLLRGRRRRLAGRADLLGEGGRLPPAGGDLARADGPATTPTAPGSACARTCSTGSTATRAGRACRPGNRRWSGCSPRPRSR